VKRYLPDTHREFAVGEQEARFMLATADNLRKRRASEGFSPDEILLCAGSTEEQKDDTELTNGVEAGRVQSHVQR
jgi:hypothetical protein